MPPNSAELGLDLSHQEMSQARRRSYVQHTYREAGSDRFSRPISRRRMLAALGVGLGTIALGGVAAYGTYKLETGTAEASSQAETPPNKRDNQPSNPSSPSLAEDNKITGTSPKPETTPVPEAHHPQTNNLTDAKTGLLPNRQEPSKTLESKPKSPVTNFFESSPNRKAKIFNKFFHGNIRPEIITNVFHPYLQKSIDFYQKNKRW